MVTFYLTVPKSDQHSRGKKLSLHFKGNSQCQRICEYIVKLLQLVIEVTIPQHITYSLQLEHFQGLTHQKFITMMPRGDV